MASRTHTRFPHVLAGARRRRHLEKTDHGVRHFVREHPVLGTAIGAAAVGAVALIAKRRRNGGDLR